MCYLHNVCTCINIHKYRLKLPDEITTVLNTKTDLYKELVKFKVSLAIFLSEK